MRVSQFYSLGKRQSSLEFLDVDIEKDTPLFINARALRLLKSDFGDHCADMIQSYFSELLDAAKIGNANRAIYLLSQLKEPNEIHLGLSKGKSKGRGLGPEKAKEIWRSFQKSKAVKTGLLTDLEDTVLLIEGISVDILSDIITNIIRGPLISYTIRTCQHYGIPLENEVSSGPVWNLNKKSWENDFVKLPMPNDNKLILVPKSIVRLQSDYNVSEYYRHYVLEKLKEEEEEQNSSLVRLIKTGKNKGKKKVYKSDVEAKYGSQQKIVSIEQTQNFPEILKKYKQDHSAPTPALTHRQLADALDTEMPNWDALLESVLSLEAGKKFAYQYEEAILDLLKALFYPTLVDPDTQTPIHDGIKRVDITFTNYARTGFFEWLGRSYNCPYIFVECKNFGDEIGNPEIDQIAMRLSKLRGMFGMLFCRKIENKSRMVERCKAIAKDDNKFIIVLDDSDISTLVDDSRGVFPQTYEFSLLKEKFKQLVF